MRVLITGAGGFIGSHLTKALAHAHELLTPSEDEMNLRQRLVVDHYIREHQPEVVIHLAAKTEVAKSFDDYEDFNRVNYLGTVLLAEANVRLNKSLKQFIFASTMETYGDLPYLHGSPFTERTDQNPLAPYAVAKVACEKYLFYLAQAHTFPFTVLRQTNAYGRTNTDFFVMERILTQMLDGNVCNLGEPSPYRNFLFIDDLIDLYRTIIGNRNALGEVFVTGPDNAITIADLVVRCAKALDWHGKVNWNTIPKRPGEVYWLDSDPAKAKKLLGWEPKVTLEEGIPLTIERIKAARALKAA